MLSELVSLVRPLARRPLIVKLSPNVARIEPLAAAAEQAGADAISLVNTFVSLAIDAHARRPRIGAGFGGLSGSVLAVSARAKTQPSSWWPARRPSR